MCGQSKWTGNSRNEAAIYRSKTLKKCVRFEVFTVVAMKKAVFWLVTPCGSCKNRLVFLCSVVQLLVTLKVVPSSVIFSPWWWRRYFPPKRRFFQKPHGITSQETAFFTPMNYLSRRNNAQNYWGSGLCPSSGFLKIKKRNVSETGSVSVFRWREEDIYSVGSPRKS
jgi:hypothetical protein